MSDEHWEAQGWTKDEHGHWHPPGHEPQPEAPPAATPTPAAEPQLVSPPSKKGGVIAAVAIVLGVGGIALYGSQHDTKSTVKAPPVRSLRHVLYEVEGTTSQASLTYQSPSGGSAQQNDVDVPIYKKSDHSPGIEGDFPAGAFLYISAQNSKSSGTVTCRITVDGIKVAENTSSGGFAIATCSGSA